MKKSRPALMRTIPDALESRRVFEDEDVERTPRHVSRDLLPYANVGVSNYWGGYDDGGYETGPPSGYDSGGNVRMYPSGGKVNLRLVGISSYLNGRITC